MLLWLVVATAVAQVVAWIHGGASGGGPHGIVVMRALVVGLGLGAALVLS